MTAKEHNTIPWHEEMLRRYLDGVKRKKQELARLQTEIANWEAQLDYYRLQIDEAVKAKKEKFDRYNYLKKRSPTWNSPT